MAQKDSVTLNTNTVDRPIAKETLEKQETRTKLKNQLIMS
jgi:hypothetical protein